jgi:DNA primase
VDTTQQIKDRLDVADFIRGYVQLSPAGKNLKGLCPFHKEKSPSFIVSPDRQIWHCFGCNAGGDVIGFLMRYENIEFFEALKILGEKAGIDVGRVGTSDQKQLNALYEINRLAKEFYKEILRSPQSDRAREYLKSRGLKPETVEEFEIGFAPESPDQLTRHLLKMGYSIVLLEKAGLSFKTERGTYMDRFRNRIMFPINNSFGKSVGFTGRIMPENHNPNNANQNPNYTKGSINSDRSSRHSDYVIPKYVNSPETQIFNKSKILYGLDKSKSFIRESRAAVLMEGQMDFIMSWQDGIKNLAATSGTALTPEHLKTLKRIADNLILSFDQDEAGKMATERTIDMANSADFNTKVILVPAEIKAKDPADIALANPGILKTLAENAKPAMEYYLHKFSIFNFQFSKSDIAEKKKNIRAALSKIKSLASAIDRDYWLKEVAKLTGFSEANLIEEAENLKSDLPKTDAEEAPNNQQPPLSRKELISQRIASLVVNAPNLYQEIAPDFSRLPASYQTVLNASLNKAFPLPPNLKGLADLVSLRSGLEANLDEEKGRSELKELVRQLKLENCKEMRQELLGAIRLAESQNDDAKLTEALQSFDRVSKEIQNLETNDKKA